MGPPCIGLPFVARALRHLGHSRVARKIERGEAALRELGFRQFRVRAHGELARIELASEEFERGLDPELARRIAAGLKEIGFVFVALDLEGYRQGSLNSVLKLK